MPRPPKCRRVDFVPEITFFKPAGIPLAHLEEIRLSLEEAEAIRLKDLEGLEQEECAKRMLISRPTFHRVLGSARKKVADALLYGKAIRIEGGNFEMAMRRFRCGDDGKEWDVPFDRMVSGPPQVCPRCDSSNVYTLHPQGLGLRDGRRGRGRRMGQRR